MPFDPTSFVQSAGGYRSIPLSDLPVAQVDQWKEAGIVLLVGSYFSTFSPSNLPTGKACVTALWSTVFPGTRHNGGPWPGWLEENFSKLPFEVVLQNCPDENGIRRSIQKTFGVTGPDPLHTFVGEQLKEGGIRSIITTNYDLCFDTVLEGAQEVCIIWDKNSWEINRSAFERTGKILWKIHGSAHPGALESLVFNQQGERQMEPWKQELLRNLVKDKTLIILGYSGSDFDICPELATGVRPRHVVWLQRSSQDLTLNAKRVLVQQRGTLVTGDLDCFLTFLFGDHPMPVAGAGTLNLSVSPACVPLWRVQVLDSIGCGSLMLEEIGNLGESAITMEKRSAAYANIGRYFDAVLERRLKLADHTLDESSKLECELDIASSRFIYGAHIGGWKDTTQAEKKIRAQGLTDLLTKVAEIKLMMLMRLGQVAERTRTVSLLRLILLKVKAAEMYQETCSALASKGHWGRLHGLRLTAQRLGITSMNGEDELTLPALENYLSVGHSVMVSISIRDEVRSRGPWRLSPLKRDACLWGIKTARRYHWKHEEWKFRWLLLLRGGGKFRWRHWQAWWRPFKQTQYTLSGRLMQLIFNSTFGAKTVKSSRALPFSG